MTATLQDKPLAQLSDLVASRLGLHFPQERWNDLERGTRSAAQDCGLADDVEGFIGRLLSSLSTQPEWEILASHLTVGETYFFREKHSLDVFEQRIVPELMRTRNGLDRQLKIWSAGCATGEEPYSIAILLSKIIPNLKDWKITLLATDLNTHSLRKASEGIYTDWSFRDTPSWVKSKYFKAAPGGRWAIDPAIKKMVTFAHLNLVEDVYPALLNSTDALDVILCRNVLMYLTPEAMKKVIHQFYKALADGSWLIVSPTETSHVLFSEFASVNVAGATLYCKGSAPGQQLPLHPFSYVQHEVTPDVQSPEPKTERRESIEASLLEVSPGPPNDNSNPDIAASSLSYDQALELYQLGRYKDAARELATLVCQNPNDTQATLLLARVYANQGKLTTALACCEKAIASDKMSASAYYLRATILQEQDSPQEAIESLRRAVYVDPRFTLGYFTLGNLALQHGKRKESEKHFENALLLLAGYGPEETVPESEGLSAGRLREMIALQSNQRDPVIRSSQKLTHTPGKMEVTGPGRR
jgi:chemotaxis protein methyltransferase CheR